MCVPVLGTMVTFLIHPYLEDEPFTVGRALSTLSLFNIISGPTTLFGIFIISMVTARVSAGRLLKFFLSVEVEGADMTGVNGVTTEHSDFDVSLLFYATLILKHFQIKSMTSLLIIFNNAFMCNTMFSMGCSDYTCKRVFFLCIKK